jgi:hypothetical protein
VQVWHFHYAGSAFSTLYAGSAFPIHPELPHTSQETLEKFLWKALTPWRPLQARHFSTPCRWGGASTPCRVERAHHVGGEERAHHAGGEERAHHAGGVERSKTYARLRTTLTSHTSSKLSASHTSSKLSTSQTQARHECGRASIIARDRRKVSGREKSNARNRAREPPRVGRGQTDSQTDRPGQLNRQTGDRQTGRPNKQVNRAATHTTGARVWHASTRTWCDIQARELIETVDGVLKSHRW